MVARNDATRLKVGYQKSSPSNGHQLTKIRSSQENGFRITGHLRRESTGHPRWIPLTKGQ